MVEVLTEMPSQLLKAEVISHVVWITVLKIVKRIDIITVTIKVMIDTGIEIEIETETGIEIEKTTEDETTRVAGNEMASGTRNMPKTQVGTMISGLRKKRSKHRILTEHIFLALVRRALLVIIEICLQCLYSRTFVCCPS